MDKEKKKYFESLFKSEMQKEVNQYLMEQGLTPMESLDWLKKNDIIAYVINHNIETRTPLKSRS